MKIINTILITALLVRAICMQTALAHVATPPEVWHGKLHAGGIINSGNTSTKNIHGKLSVDYAKNDWENGANLEYQLSKDKHKTTANRFIAAAKTHYLITQRSYIFVNGDAKFDKFGTYDRSYKESLGYGHSIFKTDVTKLNVELGPGGTQNKIAGTDTYQNQLVGKIAGSFNRKFNNNVQYTQDAISYIGKDNTYIQWKHGIETRFSKRIAMEIAFVLEYNSNIPKGSKNRKHTDTITKLSLIYDFV